MPCKRASLSIGALLGSLEGVRLPGLSREKKSISGFLSWTSRSLNHEQRASEELHTTITPVIKAVNCCLIEGTTPQQQFRLLAAFGEIGYYSLSSCTAPFSTPVACTHFTAFMPYILCLVQHIHSTSPQIHIISTTMPILSYRQIIIQEP
jgi:hypothetical protein